MYVLYLTISFFGGGSSYEINICLVTSIYYILGIIRIITANIQKYTPCDSKPLRISHSIQLMHISRFRIAYARMLLLLKSVTACAVTVRRPVYKYAAWSLVPSEWYALNFMNNAFTHCSLENYAISWALSGIQYPEAWGKMNNEIDAGWWMFPLLRVWRVYMSLGRGRCTVWRQVTVYVIQ